jgi:hypothetical protein
MVIAPQFDGAQRFSQTLAAVRVGAYWGFIDNAGQVAIPVIFDDALGFSEGLAAIKTGGKVGFVNKSGEMVIKPQFDMPGSFQRD